MTKRRNTRINTMFSESIFDWLHAESEKRGQSLAQVVRDKVSLAKRDDAVLERIAHLEKVIKKSHGIITQRLDGDNHE